MSQEKLDSLEAHGEFIQRHIGPDDHDVRHMLDVVGAADTLDGLVEATLPPSILDERPLDLAHALNETETLARLLDTPEEAGELPIHPVDRAAKVGQRNVGDDVIFGVSHSFHSS